MAHAALNKAEYFDCDELDRLVERAVKLNSNSGTNVYIGAALRDPDCPPMGRSNDDDFYALTALYVDLDDPGAAEAAKEKISGLKPSYAVITGSVPHNRAQFWWRLNEPITNPQESESVLRSMAHNLGGDVKVCNPGRVMRLGGSVAWPMKDGRVIEITRTQHIDRADVTLEQIEAEFPGGDAHASNQHSSERAKREEVRAKTGLGLDGDVVDGRETYMRDTVMAVFIELTGTTGSIPEAQELFDAAWRQYESNVDLSRPGRGHEEFMDKCKYIVNRFHSGRLRDFKTIKDVVEAYHARPRQDPIAAHRERREK